MGTLVTVSSSSRSLHPQYIAARAAWELACVSGDELDIAVAAVMLSRAAKLTTTNTAAVYVGAVL